MGSSSSRVSTTILRLDLAPSPQEAITNSDDMATSLEAGQSAPRGPGRGARAKLIPSMFRSNRASGYVAVPPNLDVPQSEASCCPERVVRKRGKGPAPPSFAKEVKARRAAGTAMPTNECGQPTREAETKGFVVTCGSPPSALQEACAEVGCSTRKDGGGRPEEEAGFVHSCQPAPSVSSLLLADGASAEAESIALAEKVKRELLLLLETHGDTFLPEDSHSREIPTTHHVVLHEERECETKAVPVSAAPRPSPCRTSCSSSARTTRTPLRAPLLRSPTVRSPGVRSPGSQLRGKPLSPLNVTSPGLRDR